MSAKCPTYEHGAPY